MPDPAAPEPLSYPQNARQWNNFTTDRNLERFLLRACPGLLHKHRDMLHSLGAFCAGPLDEQAQYSSQVHPPALRRELDSVAAPDRRIGRIVLNDRYKDCQQELYRRGVVAGCFDGNEPGGHMLAFLAQYLVSYADISTGCPLAMTHPDALVLATRAPQTVRDKFLPQFLRTDGRTMVGATWATEWAGGSDVRGNTRTVAVPAGGADGRCTVTGRNFFTSAMGFDSWGAMKTARMTDESGREGIALVFIPRFTDGKWDEDDAARQPNNIDVAHLKEKSGTAGLATVEVELEGATGYLIAGPKDGLRVMMEALGVSRIHNAMAAAGVMHRAYVEAMCWAQHRKTFGNTLDRYEDIQEDLLKLKTEWLGAAALAFEAAKSFGDALADPARTPWLRVATALAKYRTAEKATECTSVTTEIVGGIGYTRDHPIERIHRDAMVLRVWEGPKNIQARELVHILRHGGAEAFISRLGNIAAGLDTPPLAREKTRLLHIRNRIQAGLTSLLPRPEKDGLAGQRFLKDMAKALTYALLCEEAGHEIRAHNDCSKQLVARAFYEENYRTQIKPSLQKSALHRHFTQIARNLPIPPPPQKTPPPPRPA